MKNKKIYIALIALFLLIAAVSGGICIHQLSDAREAADSFRDLEDMLVLPIVSTQTTEGTASTEPAETVDPEIAEAKATFEKYKALYEQNEDLVGWISIEGTAVNYPVMQSVDQPDFYLKHGFDRQYSRYGVPYLDEACATGLSNNLVIYGHNMKNGTMFHDLLNYTSEDFRKDNPIIHFDTLSRMGEYQVVLVFRFDTDNETFCYNEYTDMDEAEFVEFMEQCRQRQLYDTGISVSYGDELLTLSTCEYTYKNGRFVVVAKRIMD